MTDYVDIIGRLELAAPHAATFSEKELLAEAAACIREMVEWRPIETAPRDGTVIHVYAPGFDWPEAVLWELYDPDDAEETGEDGYWTYAESLMADATDSCEPELWTHWRPITLPPAPGAEDE